VLRLVHPAAVVVAQVALRVQPAAHFEHVLLVAVRSVVVAALARCDVVHVAHYRCHAELAEPAEPQVVTTFAPFAVHRVRDARLAPGTFVPSHDRAPYSRAGPSPDSDGTAWLPVLRSLPR
jgi:hypothetical protein